MADFAIDFRTLANQSEWNPAALVDAFLHGLADYIKDALVAYDLPLTLDEVIKLAVRLDLRVQARRRERRQGALTAGREEARPPLPTSGEAEPEPMQLGRTTLSREEWRRRRQGSLCLYCGGKGHFVASCPVKDKTHPKLGSYG